MIKIDFEKTGVSSIIKNYLADDSDLKPHYNRLPKEENYIVQAKEKLQNYNHRKVLHAVIKQQMESLCLSENQIQNLQNLSKPNTVTVTTGHQLNLLTGPLYFIYKILHTVKICDELNRKNTKIQYVPIYWMATEDHDFDEINHFNNYKKTFKYQAESGGYVGNINSNNTTSTLENFIKTLPQNDFSEKLKSIIQKSFFQNYDLATATTVLVNELLGEFGILILDANHPDLKKLLIPYFEKELVSNPTHSIVGKTNEQLAKYKNQAYAREINLFYLNDTKRERIEKNNDKYILTDSKKEFTQEELLDILRNHPERFSPNVILRPLYQEVILPNVAYVGGGGEIAYWLQLKAVFDYYAVNFPMLVVRNSILLLPNAIKHKAKSLNLLSDKIFTPRHQLKKDLVIKDNSLFEELQTLRLNLLNNFEKLEDLSENTDEIFKQMVQAQKKKQLNGYDKFQKRLIKAEQIKQEALIKKVDEVYDYVFPNNSWQERVINFSEFYKSNGPSLFHIIYDEIPAFESAYYIISLNSILK